MVRPGIPYATARSATWSTEVVSRNEVESAYWLFSQMKTRGSFHTEARLSDSWKTPWFAAPSPKKATATRPVPSSRAARPAPVERGIAAPTMPFAPRMLRPRSAMCIEPPSPWQ